MSFEDKYKNWFENLDKKDLSFPEKRSLDRAWEEIEEELVLDETWTGIGAALNSTGPASSGNTKAKTHPLLKPYTWIPAVLIITASLVWWALPSPEDQKPKNAESARISTEQADESVRDKNQPPRENFTPSTTTNENNSSKLYSPSHEMISDNDVSVNDRTRNNKKVPENQIITGTTNKAKEAEFLPEALNDYLISDREDKIQVVARDKPAIEKDNNFSLMIPDISLPDIPFSLLDFNLPDPGIVSQGSVSPFRISNWYFYGLGISLSYNNSWILNDETLAGLDPGTLTDTRLSYAPEIGLSVMFASRKGSRLEMELFLFSEQRQRYNQYINAQYQERQLILSYQKIHLSWQTPLGFFPGRIGLGAYTAYLDKASERIGDKTRSLEDLYNQFDYGLSLDYKLELAVNERLMFAPAFRLQYSLPNIFKGDATIPGEFRRTNNASAGINLRIFYRF